MARLNVLENSPTQWTITKEAGLKGALQDGTTGINTNALEVQGVAITATPSELNILDGATLSTVELNYVDGVTSSIQSQIDNKADDSSLTSHTGDSTIHFTQGSISIPASTISDFDTEVSNNTDVSANTSARHDAVTVTDSSEIDFTLTGQDITGSLKSGSIDETKLDTSVNASLDLADSALQSGDNISELTNDSGYTTNTGTVDTSGSPVDNDFAKFTDSSTIEGRSSGEVLNDLGL